MPEIAGDRLDASLSSRHESARDEIVAICAWGELRLSRLRSLALLSAWHAQEHNHSLLDQSQIADHRPLTSLYMAPPPPRAARWSSAVGRKATACLRSRRGHGTRSNARLRWLPRRMLDTRRTVPAGQATKAATAGAPPRARPTWNGRSHLCRGTRFGSTRSASAGSPSTR